MPDHGYEFEFEHRKPEAEATRKAEIESRNLLDLTTWVLFAVIKFVRIVSNRWPPESPIASPELVLQLNQIAVSGLESTAGQYRSKPRFVADHIPPRARDVPTLVQEMCDHANATDDPFYAAAFVVWRVCWIHPFDDGNGRVARALCYLYLCILMEHPASPVFLTRIMERKDEYYAALEAADEAWKESDQDYSDPRIVQQMQDFLFDIYIDLDSGTSRIRSS